MEKFDFRKNSDGDREIWGSQAVTMKIDLFCDVTPCNQVDMYRSFGGTCYVLLQLWQQVPHPSETLINSVTSYKASSQEIT